MEGVTPPIEGEFSTAPWASQPRTLRLPPVLCTFRSRREPVTIVGDATVPAREAPGPLKTPDLWGFPLGLDPLDDDGWCHTTSCALRYESIATTGALEFIECSTDEDRTRCTNGVTKGNGATVRVDL